MNRLTRFAAVGTAGFLLDAAVLVLLTELLGINPFVARIPSFLAAATLTWWLNRSWTFMDRSHAPVFQQWIRYLLAMKVGAAVNLMVYALALGFSNTVYMFPALGVAAGSIAGLTVNYLLATRLIFPVEEGTSESRSSVLMDWRGAWVLAGLMPIGFGILSLFRGQDRNWDLLNYHLYVPYAWLEGRHSIDLAAAQLQSYFPPLIDLPYYLAIQSLPGPAVALLMGLLHGLVFIPLFAIARQFVSLRTALILSLAGCLGSAWMSGLGTTMGDNLAATGVILSFLLLLPVIRGESRAAEHPLRWLMGAGVLLGIFVGLKITNGIYALALMLAFLLSCPGSLRTRIGFVMVLGLSALAGLLASAGYWFYFLWTEFGNPLFPQFNQWFGAPLASATGVVDQANLPQSYLQALFWPLRLLTDPYHFSEVGQRSVVWLVLAVTAGGLVVQQLLTRIFRKVQPQIRNEERFLLLFLLTGFVLWIFTFSIFRYLVALELLAPLAVWVIIRRLTPRRINRFVNPALLSLIVIVAIVGTESWGHARLAWKSVQVEVPELNQPRERVLVLVGDQPQSWRLPWWPPEVAFLGLASNFPENERFAAEAHDRLGSRAGPHLAMLPASGDRGEDTLDMANEWLAVRQVPAQGRVCQFLDRLASERNLNLAMLPLPGRHPDDSVCQFYSLTRDEAEAEKAARNRDIARQNAELLRPYSLSLHLDTCQLFNSRLGSQRLPYQICQITLDQESSE